MLHVSTHANVPKATEHVRRSAHHSQGSCRPQTTAGGAHGEPLLYEPAVRILNPGNWTLHPLHGRRLHAFRPLGQHRKKPTPLARPFQVAAHGQLFVYWATPIHDAIRSLREVCVLRHLPSNTEKTGTHWLGHDGALLRPHGFTQQVVSRRSPAGITCQRRCSGNLSGWRWTQNSSSLRR
jgi:hypothetical protein